MEDDKLLKLDSILRDLGSFVIGFSGGLDSSFLVHRASLQKDLRFVAVTVHTTYVPEREIREAVAFSKEFNIEHEMIEVPFPGDIRNNPAGRCY
ncbi:MAG TPA: 7-cyano-7-deazaguanine synthase, partial [Bacteroidales bacterium]|nr:7-cyano-7-deazaguanine synthase [Bacteroidales bacterium]